MRIRVFALCLLLPGCAAVFRDSKVQVKVESDPPGAAIRQNDQVLGTTPTTLEMERNEPTDLRITKEGYGDNRGVVKKSLDVGWVIADVATCVIPVALCIPLLVDAVSGAWMNLQQTYRVRLGPPEPGAPAPTIVVPPPPGAAPLPPPSSAPDGGVEPGTITL